MRVKNIAGIAVVSMLAVSAQAINWDNGAPDNKWSSAGNWVGDNVPDNNSETAAFVGAANVAIDVDQNFTIKDYTDGFGGAGFTHTLYGAGTLTVDVNSAGNSDGIKNSTGNAGGTLRFNGKVAINNSGGGRTYVRNNNSSGNTTLFDTGSSLTLNTILQTVTSAGGSIQFNGALASSSANLVIGSDNVSFGAGHDSSGFGRDVVFNAGAKLAIDGGTVLNAGRKFQVNGSGALELNGANAINGASVVVGGANNLLIDANSNQDDMGFLQFDSGTVTLDLANGVTGLAFDDSSTRTWGTGALVISNFTAGVVSFGTDAAGLLSGQVDKIQAYDAGGALVDGLSLNATGSVIPEPATIGLISFASIGLLALRRLLV